MQSDNENEIESEEMKKDAIDKKDNVGEDKKSALPVIIILVILVIGGLYFFTNTSENKSETTDKNSAVETKIMNPTQSDEKNELVIEDLVVGTGPEATAGKTVTVNYSGTLTNGEKFDSSYDRGQPFTFSLGAGDVIKGWDQGVAGMKVGGKRKLTIPSNLGYGSRDMGVIPPNSTLVFEVELLGVK